MKLLELRNVTAGYSNVPVIRDIAIDVEENTVAAIVGPNGHGKTALLWTISGLLKPLSGSITIGGKDITGLKPEEAACSGIAHVPQGDMLFPQMTVMENLQMGAYNTRSNSELRQRLERTYELFPKLADRRNQIASSLSGGERRMVGIGRGLMANARLLMLDEPSLGLAPIVIEQIYDALLQLKLSGMTVLLVEENPERAADFSDSAYLMDNGRIQWSGSASQLRSQEELLKTYLGM